MKISIAIPVYPMKRAKYFLTRCLDSIIEQSFDDFEVVISDNSKDDKLEKVVRTYGMKINHFYSSGMGAVRNTNSAIKQCKGELIKILHMDDYFAHKDALKDIVEAFEGHWLITASDNNLKPHYTDDVYTGNNKLGSPSALTILNENPLLFDESLSWVFDCDYYKRMYDKYGEPIILKKVGVNLGLGDHQMTNLLTDEEKLDEVMLLEERYEYGI